MNKDQCYWYERGLHAGKVLASEAQGYKEAYFALLEKIANNEALLPRQIILNMAQRKPLTGEQLFKMWEEDTSCDMPDTFKQFKHTARAIEAAHGIKE